MKEGLTRLGMHTITTKSWDIERIAQEYSKAGIKAVSVWRNLLKNRNIYKTGEIIRSYGIEIISVVRGGFFASSEKNERLRALEDTRKAIREASEIGAPMVVLVCGADARQELETSRSQIKNAIEELLPLCEELHVKLAVEPLHPMYADTRSAINTLSQANDLVEVFQNANLGVAIDVYHLWWDPNLKKEILRCGANGNIFAFHICDWISPTSDLLNDRGIMGEGCIDVKQIKNWVEQTGFNGYHEVEIFSERLWKEEPEELLDKIKTAYLTKVL